METFSDFDQVESIKTRKLEENAITLAKTSSRQVPEGEMRAYVVFSSGSGKFLIDADHVIEVVRYREVVQLPGIDRKLDGIYNFRGAVTGVYSARHLLGEEGSPPAEPRYLLICSNSGVNFALACDDIAGIENRLIVEMKTDEGAEILKNIFAGVFPDSARLLDVEKLMGDRILVIS